MFAKAIEVLSFASVVTTDFLMPLLEQCGKPKCTEYMLFLLCKDIENKQCLCTQFKSSPSFPTELHQFCLSELFLSLLDCVFKIYLFLVLHAVPNRRKKSGNSRC